MAKPLTNGSLAAQLDRATRKNGTFDKAACIRLAKANAIWKDGYERLDNGRLSMNTRNGIRTKVKRGEKVTWR